MTTGPTVLVVGRSDDELHALHQVADGAVGGASAVLGIEVSGAAIDPDLAWGRGRSVVRLLSAPSRPLEPEGVEQPLGEDGEVWKSIVDAAHRHHVDLVVVAIDRRSWLRRMTSRSVSRDLLERSDLPVLAVPATALGSVA